MEEKLENTIGHSIHRGKETGGSVKKSAWLLMTPRQWATSLLAALAMTLLLLPWYGEMSILIGAGIFIAVFTSINIIFTAKLMFPFPQLAILINCIQYILAAWGNNYYPVRDPVFGYHPYYNILERLPTYLDYAVPACLLFIVGMTLPFIFKRLYPVRFEGISLDVHMRRRLKKELNALFIIGIIASMAQRFVPASLSFFFYLMGNLLYVGVFGYMLLQVRGWKFRAGAAMVFLIAQALAGGFFHSLVLWGFCYFFFIAYLRRWRARRVGVVFLSSAVAVLLILSIKNDYRKQFWYGTESFGETRVEAFVNLIVDRLLSPQETLSDENIGDVMLRLNQGWIVNRVMVWTPKAEPFAYGLTIVTSMVDGIVPRFLNPLKEVIGGKEDFVKYTGLELFGASMELGYAGEMYVNFGYWGGIIGVGIYGLLLGLFFRWFYLKASEQPLWWAWGPYLFLALVRAENSIGYLFNWTVKSLIILFFVFKFSPAFRQLLIPKFRRHSS